MFLVTFSYLPFFPPLHHPLYLSSCPTRSPPHQVYSRCTSTVGVHLPSCNDQGRSFNLKFFATASNIFIYNCSSSRIFTLFSCRKGVTDDQLQTTMVTTLSRLKTSTGACKQSLQVVTETQCRTGYINHNKECGLSTVKKCYKFMFDKVLLITHCEKKS